MVEWNGGKAMARETAPWPLPLVAARALALVLALVVARAHTSWRSS